MNPRFRPLTPDEQRRPEDHIAVDLEQLEAELTASIARLDGVLPARPETASKDPLAGESRFPPLDLPYPDAGRKTTGDVPPVATAAAAVPPPSSPDLLSELRQVAEQKAEADDALETERKARAERTDQAMRTLFRYLTEFARHLDKIQPAVPYTFRPLPNIELSGLHWSESFVDYRTRGGTEISPLDSLSLRYTLSAGDRVRVGKLPQHAGAYLDELKRVGLRYTATEKRGARGLVAEIEFQVERSINVNLLFKADPAAELISIRARNFNGLGHTAYVTKVADIDRALLDELGKHVLGRPNQLFQRLILDNKPS